MSKTIHMSLDIRGFLINHSRDSDFAGMFTTDTGGRMEPRKARIALLDLLAQGKKFLPIGPCDNFDDQTGCKGHDDSGPHYPLGSDDKERS